MERTLIIIKPDAVKRRLLGEILSRIERKGLTFRGLKLVAVDEARARRLYSVHQGKPFYEPLVRFITSGPCAVAVVEGLEAIEVVRRLLGDTFGAKAAAGTIRGDLALSNRFNLVHGSDSPETAQREIALFFTEEELLQGEPPDWPLLYAENERG